MRDIEGGADPQVLAVAEVIRRAAPDVLLLIGIDYDHELRALRALATLLANDGPGYPHLFALRPNSGMATGLDLDGDGRTGGPRDAQGYGRFAGQAGMALLSRLPIEARAAQDLSQMLWRDLPGAFLPTRDGAPFPSAEALAAQRLSSTAHWIVPIGLPGGDTLRLLCWSATPPVFDGPEDLNGRRNHDEAALWLRLLDGDLPGIAKPSQPFVLIGKANLDPDDGEGRTAAIRALLAHPRLHDPAPQSEGGRLAAQPQPQEARTGAPHHTVDWPEPPEGPGNLRVDYILPSSDVTVVGSGVLWPAPDDPLAAVAAAASPHRLVWVDLDLP